MTKKNMIGKKFAKKTNKHKLYNKYLLKLTSRDMTYGSFCKAVTRAGHKTAISIVSQCRGWYAASESILNQAI